MDRVGQILRALFARALSDHEQDAPALTDIIIERARARMEPRLGAEFSNGYRTFAPLAPADCYSFCERHAAWDLRSLRAALLREGERIYLQMREDHLLEQRRLRLLRDDEVWFRARGRRSNLLDRLRREADALNLDATWTGRGDLAGRAPAMREPRYRRSESGNRLMQWWAHQREQLTGSVFFLRGPGDVGSKRAQERGLHLLKENLTPGQRQQYNRHGYFDVVGGNTGKRYRIRHGRQMNIEQLDKAGRRVCGWCFFPQGSLVAGDVMLGQKVALELYELEALRIANRY